MAKRLVQGAAAPVYICDGDGRIIDADAPLDVRVNQDTPIKVQLEPVENELQNPVQGIASTSGNNTIIPAPAANRRIVITAFVIQNESATATTMILKDGTALAAGRWRCLGQNQGDGLAMVFDGQHPWRLSAGNGLVLNLSGANQCGYSIQYYLETV